MLLDRQIHMLFFYLEYSCDLAKVSAGIFARKKGCDGSFEYLGE
jgi:hypothetical protein